MHATLSLGDFRTVEESPSKALPARRDVNAGVRSSQNQCSYDLQRTMWQRPKHSHQCARPRPEPHADRPTVEPGVYGTWQGLLAQVVAFTFVIGSYVLAERQQKARSTAPAPMPGAGVATTG